MGRGRPRSQSPPSRAGRVRAKSVKESEAEEEVVVSFWDSVVPEPSKTASKANPRAQVLRRGLVGKGRPRAAVVRRASPPPSLSPPSPSSPAAPSFWDSPPVVQTAPEPVIQVRMSSPKGRVGGVKRGGGARVLRLFRVVGSKPSVGSATKKAVSSAPLRTVMRKKNQ